MEGGGLSGALRGDVQLLSLSTQERSGRQRRRCGRPHPWEVEQDSGDAPSLDNGRPEGLALRSDDKDERPGD